MTTTPAPILETERLILRGPEPRDIPRHAAFYQTERSRFVGGPRAPGQSWRSFAAIVGQWWMQGFGFWVVTAKGDDTALGCVGCWFPGDWPEHEFGWFMFEGEGRGYAFEAVQAARACAYGRFGWTGAVSYIHPDNARSIRLAERLGCVRDDTARRPETHEHVLVYRHPGPEALR
jgi:RimJ/RimL family protein N-acetyltransferase